MPLALADFLRAELDIRDLSAREFSRRSALTLSHVYQLLRGTRVHTRPETIDKIARGLHMTPAELYARMGKTSEDPGDPDEVELVALFRDVPQESRSVVLQVVRGLGLSISQPLHGANRRNVTRVNRAVENEQSAAAVVAQGSNPSLTAHYPPLEHDAITRAA